MEITPSIATEPEILESGNASANANADAKVDDNRNLKLEKGLNHLFKDTFKTEADALKLVEKEGFSADADKALSEIVGMFHEMDKMINGLDKKLDEEGENRAFGNFVTGLKNMFT